MLSEQIVVSTLRSPNDPATESTLSIYDLHTYKPVTAFKRSDTAPNGLAVTNSHLYAAQADKAVVNVYSRQKGALESIIPFSEQFTIIEASHNGVFIAGGTENGRLTIWEAASGRFISTGHIHLQRITAIAFDPSDNFILTGSADSNVHVWSVPILTDFRSERKPERILDLHQREITSIVCGKGDGPANISITASRDLSCIVWNYQTGTLLRRFLFSLPPLVLAIDPADRAFYAGFEDGSLQCVDFHGDSLPQPSSSSARSDHKLFVQEGRNVPVTVSGTGKHGGRWASAGHDSAITAIGVMYEGNSVVTGNAKGEVCVWDVATGSLFRHIVQSKGVVTSIKLLRPTGFLSAPTNPTTLQSSIVKPRYDSILSSGPSSAASASGPIPPSTLESYTITTQFVSTLPGTNTSPFLSSTTPPSCSYSAFSTEGDLDLILSGAREMEVGASPSSASSSASAAALGPAGKRRVEELEEELSRMYANYERLAALHKGLWERQATLMMEVEEGRRRKEGSAGINGDRMLE
ncbi:WD40-repeat-containing domain protein [Kalaharituber pfeilii]|nr:WD40-repeat-containing domain protein [Kalaharituber pfeilii]